MRIKSPKIAIYLIVVVSLISPSLFYFCTKTSSAENLFITALGMAVTILLIDTLLAADRKQKYKSLNKHVASNLRITVELCLINSRESLGDKKKYTIDNLEISTDKLASLFEEGLDMLVLNTYNNNLNDFCDIISNYAKSIDKTLPVIVPLASTELRKLVSDLSIRPEMLSELHKIRSKTSATISNSKPNEVEQQVISDIDEFLIEQYKKIINEIKTTLLKIHKLACEDKLQEIV